MLVSTCGFKLHDSNMQTKQVVMTQASSYSTQLVWLILQLKKSGRQKIDLCGDTNHSWRSEYLISRFECSRLVWELLLKEVESGFCGEVEGN